MRGRVRACFTLSLLVFKRTPPFSRDISLIQYYVIIVNKTRENANSKKYECYSNFDINPMCETLVSL